MKRSLDPSHATGHAYPDHHSHFPWSSTPPR